MKKQLVIIALAILVGVLGFVVAGVAVAGNGQPPSPPGQGECGHGNSGQPCKPDPQPEKGKDCAEHGNQGGVNEDHCTGGDQTTTETTTTEPTKTETTTTEPTTRDSTTTASTTTEATSTEKVSSETTSTQTTPTATPPSETTTPTPTFVGKPPVAAPTNKTAVLGATANAPKPTREPQKAPFTL